MLLLWGKRWGWIFFLCAFTKKKFPNDIANAAPHPLVFCYKAGIYSKTEWIKSQRGWRVSRPILKCAGKNCKGHILSIPGTLDTQGALPTSRSCTKTTFLIQEGTKQVVHSWSFTCLCWLLNSFSIIMKSSLKRGFSSNVNSWNMISICILHSILYFSSFLDVYIHLIL